jgi:hypothetical protein
MEEAMSDEFINIDDPRQAYHDDLRLAVAGRHQDPGRWNLEPTQWPEGGYVVICPDGAIRHARLFADLSAALEFADRGHPCMHVRHHRLITVPPLEGQ